MHSGRLASLMARKAELEAAVSTVPNWDTEKVATLKRQKLMVKDEITRLSQAA